MDEINRMRQLIKSFELKNEIIRESKGKVIDENAMKTESDRLKTIARVNESFAVDSPSFAKPKKYIAGETVNTFMSKDDVNQNPNSNKLYNPNYTYLLPSEALELCIKRTLESGAPVNNIGFYEEINWNLNNLGFPSKAPLDIKTAISKFMKD